MKTKLILISVLSCLALNACAKKKAGTEALPSTTSALALPSTMLGRKIHCGTWGGGAGTALNGKTYGNTLNFAADGTYAYEVYYTSATTCVSGLFPSGGEDVFRFDQQGTYAITSLALDGSYAVTLTPMAEQFTARNFGPMGPLMKDAVNTNCTPSPGLSGASTTTIGAMTCGAADPTYIVPNTPANGAPIYQVLKASGSDVYTGTPDTAYYFGNNTVTPASAPVLWYNYP